MTSRILFAAVLSLASLPVHAQEIPRAMGPTTDTWSEPNPGIRYLRRTAEAPLTSIHALVVDLAREGVSIETTAEAERWDTVTGYARRHDAAAVVNGGFWGLMQSPTGITAGGGETWRASAPDPDFGHFGIRTDGRAVIHAPGDGEDERSLARLRGAVSGRPMLVVDGAVDTGGLDLFGTANLRQPRTAIGVSRDGRTVFIVVADGRQSHSRGLTLYQLARVLVELGAHRAINLDGGGSSAMYVERAGGLVSSPARGRWARALGLEEDATVRARTRGGHREVYVRGVEREVMNHVAVFAPNRDVALAGSDDVLLDGLGHIDRRRVSLLPERPQPIRLGRVREWLYPSLYVSAPLFMLLGLALVTRRLVRRTTA